MLFHLVVSMVILVLVNGQGNSCPDGWHLYQEGNSCVKVFDDIEKTWDEARAECQTHDGDLVKTDNPVIRDLVADLLSQGRRYWMGLHGDNTGDFEWVDGPEQTSFQWWTCRQPSNNYMEQCVEMIGSKRGRWNDMECSRKRRFVCQVPTKAMTGGNQINGNNANGVFVTCDFEREGEQFSIFRNTSDWTRQKAETHSEGPTFDSSNSTEGHFLFVFNATIELILSRDIEEKSCLSFWYVLKGQVNVTMIEDPLHAINADTDNTWTHTQFDLPAGHENPYSISVNASDGYFAVDDAQFSGQPCDSLGMSED